LHRNAGADRIDCVVSVEAQNMSYREENGQVVLTMSRQGYAQLLMLLAQAMATFMMDGGGNLAEDTAFLNGLNEGNPNYTPYQVKKTCPTNEGRS
jgi:hypothetical protein